MTLNIDIARLYRAGKVDIPEEAARMSAIAQDLFDVLGSFNSMTACAGDPAALRNLLKVGGDVYDEIRDTVGGLNNIGVAVIKTADQFRATDTEAQQQYDGMSRSLKDLDVTPSPQPPDIGDVEDAGANDEEGSRIESTPAPVDPGQAGGVR